MSPAIAEQQPRSNDHAGASNFLVWPGEKVTRDQINSTYAIIRKIVGPDTVVQKTLDSNGNLSFWYCPLSAEQKASIGKLDTVAEIEKDDIDPDARFC
ncbi:hypothetical protein LTR22_009144 [Elasticomyces elasticus]|nr:hypothetical protein LTR22_009144 [Elasticomyces elasticus]KAK4917604.1 hypothetical protein LTR49_014558 [Elasticomyces elasticus]KAK5762824.1 hypothetical protein LTS12_007013 [Elasticomyces elasticus]